MNYWLMKSEPDVYSIDDLARHQRDHWDGVRNYQARNFMRDRMKKGDQVLFYHSNCNPPGVVGLAEVCQEACPDPSAFDKNSKYFDPKSDPANPRWVMVHVKFKRKFDRPVGLAQMKKEKSLAGMRILQKGNRLSITAVTKKEFERIVALGG